MPAPEIPRPLSDSPRFGPPPETPNCGSIWRMPRRSLAEFVAEFRRYGHDIAFVERRGYRTIRWTYAHVSETAARVARELERLGVQKGDRVVLWGDCLEWTAAFYGCILRGAVAVPIDRIATPAFALRITQQVKARVAFGPREFLAHLKESEGMVAIPFEDFDATLAVHSSSPYASP